MDIVSFEGARLTEARRARNISMRSLGESVEITGASISAYEKGIRSPGPDVVLALSRILRVPVAYFRSPRPNVEPRENSLSYRRLKRMTLSALEQVEQFETWFAELYTLVGRYIEFPETNMLEVEDFHALTLDDIEMLALDLRKHWGLGLGPIPNLMALCEAMGIIIGRIGMSKDTSGASCWRAGKPFVLLPSPPRDASSCRFRFSLAHELGHLMLHRLSSSDDFEPSNPACELMETQANRFAGAFLFPAKSYVQEVFKIAPEALLSTKRRWKLSLAAIVHRGKDLGIFSSDQESYFYLRLIERYGPKARTHEPLDSELPVENPSLFKQAFALLESTGEYSSLRCFEEASLDAADFSTLTGVTITKTPSILEFRPKIRE